MVKINIQKEIEESLSYRYVSKRNKALIQATYTLGNGKLIIVTGDNASGKSFIARLMSARAAKVHQIETMRIGMELRTGGGIINAFVFGDESWESTGLISLGAVMGGIRTCRGRETEHVILFDEPDIGLSEAYQSGMGKLLAEFCADIPVKTLYCLVVTHSRRLVKQLVHLYPHFIRVGDNKTLEQFLEEPEEKTIDDIKALKDVALERFRAISKLMKS